MFKHYLITRFNLRNPDWNVTKNNETLLTDEWMEDRMWLFENFCFPSVVAQTNTDFNWLLFFDTTTPEKYKSAITNLISDKTNIKAFYIDGMPEFYPAIQQFISEDAQNVPYLITSRIDNDDCIHKNFINEVQHKFQSQEYQAVDVIKGYSLQVKPRYILGKKEHIFNPFISLIEKNENPKTVWFNDHTLWKKETRITQITDKRLWMSIIHEKNKVNEFDGYDNVKWAHINKDFIVSEKMNSLIEKELIPYKNWMLLSLKNRLYVKLVLLSKKIKKALGVYKIK
ncbi:glycosyltransferase [Flavobacterium lindanitolerans]|uniref:glycosyltransferase n=1 Tax=Flavobacterium lindanitolerans TaxID=428988 RepID=UPI0028092A5C|nr:glycosyltransferase [Flavobacterium lindanitolerans]MDQ7961589.1 glycosyltransferase [Flavobacterium lindanitolerans]